ncbi:MAG: DUF2254 domain-containing protein [Jatrophihabitantaceae bacterium]
MNALHVVSATHLRVRARQAFWLIPTGCVAVALLLALGLPELDAYTHAHTALLFPGGPDAARSFLSSITTAMISMTGLVFSITIVALQLAAGQFSSRVMRDFLRDRVIQLTFGVFVATFTYSMVLQRSVRGSSSGGPVTVPQLAVSVAFVFVLGSVALFIVYINRIANSIRVANIVDRIGTRTRATLDTRYPLDGAPAAPPPPTSPPDRYLSCPRPGVIVSINESALVARAERSGSVLVLLPRVGDYVPAGARLIAVHGAVGSEADLLRHIAFDTERTYEQDVAFGFRELVDIAERALSPAVNDPTTAAQSIDVLHDLLRRLAIRPAPVGGHVDAAGRLRLLTPRYEFADLLDLALEEIAHYGRGDVQTPRRLHAMLADLHDVARPEYRPAITGWLQAVTSANMP